MPIKDLDLLEPSFRKRFIRFWEVLTVDLAMDARIHETWRSKGDQLAAVAAKASNNKIGKHQFGRAVDIGIYINGVYQVDDKSGLYLRAGFIGMGFGFRWGGNWDRDRNIAEPGESDLGHFEDASVTVDQLLEELDT